MRKNLQVVVDGTAISYRDNGKGPVLLFVHGWLDSKDTFDPLVEQLDSKFRCISVDLPNFGASQSTEGVVTIEQYARFLGSFINKLNIKEYTLVGHSMGGQIAIHATGSGFVEPSKIILIASAGVRSNRWLLKQASRFVSKLFRKLTPRAVKNRFYKRIGSDYSTQLSPMHKKIIHNVLTFDVQEVAAHISIPALLIYGDSDVHTPESMGKILHEKIPHSQLEVMKNQNHWLHQSAAKEVAELIKGFVR